MVKGIAEGCVLAGCALVGGETAEHPGLLGPDEYDVAGAGTGVVEAERVLGPERVRAGDVLVAMASSGLHSNGYSLVRHVLLSDAGAGWSLDRHVDELGRTLGEELLGADPDLRQGLPGADRGGRGARLLARHRRRAGPPTWRGCCRPGVRAAVDRVVLDAGAGLRAGAARSARWRPDELERTLNLGVGMVAVVAPDDADAAVRRAAGPRRGRLGLRLGHRCPLALGFTDPCPLMIVSGIRSPGRRLAASRS